MFPPFHKICESTLNCPSTSGPGKVHSPVLDCVRVHAFCNRAGLGTKLFRDLEFRPMAPSLRGVRNVR